MKYMRRTGGYNWTDYKTNAISDKIIVKVNLFDCLGNISYEGVLDIDNKLITF